MFQGIKKLFGSKKEKEQILAPVAGQAVPLSEVPDPAFAQEILGKGVAIQLLKMNSGRRHPVK